MKSSCTFTFPKKARAPHFARNLTIVSPNGGLGGQNHPKCEKSAQVHLFAQTFPFGSKSAFWVIFCILSIFAFLAPNDPESIKKPLPPQAFEPLVPENEL